MSVELTPRGTRGAGLPKLPGPILKVLTSLMVGSFRLFGGRMRVQGRPLLLLTTKGARTGKVRQTTLGWFPGGDENNWLVVASKGGAAAHPSWYVNMAKHPDQVWVEVGGRKLRVSPVSLKGGEREKAWRGVVSLAPGYGKYQSQTDREIPLVRLTAPR